MKNKQRGFWNFVIPAAASIIGGALGAKGQEDTNESNTQINSAQMAFNREEAAKNRTFQSDQAQQQMMFQSGQRQTQYKTAVDDLKASGLNPMLAYTNGGAGNTSGASGGGSQATAGSMQRMENTATAGIAGAMSAAQIANIHSQTAVNEATKEKIEAEVPRTHEETLRTRGESERNSQQTENMKQELKNMEQQWTQIRENTSLLIQQGMTQKDLRNLYKAQEQTQYIEQELKNKQITQTQAQTKLTQVETILKNLDIAGARNLSDWETTMSTGAGSANKGVEAIVRMMQALKSILGK